MRSIAPWKSDEIKQREIAKKNYDVKPYKDMCTKRRAHIFIFNLYIRAFI
jgi:hypothetical protein